MSKLLTLSLLLVGSILRAAEPQLPVLIISDNGYTWMIQDENGKPVLYEFSQVLVLGKPSTRPPTTPPIPSEFGLETQAKQWLLTIPASALVNRVEIAKALTDTAKAASEGKFNTLAEMESALGVALSVSIKDKPSWAGFGASLQAAYNTLKSPTIGKIKTPDDFGRALKEVVRGM